MNKQVEQIKAEIERLYSISLDRANITNNSYWEGKADAYRNVLISFEEPIKVTIGEPKEAEGVLGEMIKDFNPQEDLGISSEKYAEIVNECVHGKEEPVSEDLEQAAVEAFKHIVDSDKNNFYEIFKAGANWQKEQMMKGAVDGEVGYWNITGLSINMKLPKCIEDGDKVKVIIVKEE